ncbi:hypothetical protein [Buttiauxella sp. B2]|nr:hypothetical protein [Buttiauxella sp. B2]
MRLTIVAIRFGTSEADEDTTDKSIGVTDSALTTIVDTVAMLLSLW